MNFELRDWRALAIGWASALLIAMMHGVDWIVPAAAIGISMACWAFWE